jgi:hypothetical protein
MLNRSNPTVSRGAHKPSRVERKVMCTHYERCLEEAIKSKWAGFSCRNCRAFAPLRLNSTEWFEDSLACIALIFVVEFQNAFKQKTRGGLIQGVQQIRS